MTRKHTLIAAAALAALPLAAQAQSGSVAAGVNLGTPGIGAELQVQAAPGFVIRGAVDGLKIDRDEDYSGVPYSAELKSLTGGLFADWHPMGGGFLVSGGAYFGDRKLDLSAAPTAPVVIGGQTFTAAQVGRLDGEIKMSKVQPFVGLGYDNTFTADRGWGFKLIAGVALSKKPGVTLTATGGTFSPDFQTRLSQEVRDVQEDAEDFRYYPVVQVGVTRRF